MFRNIIILIVLAGTPGLLAAQSEFTDGQSAIGFGFSYLGGTYKRTTERTHMVELNFGYSIAGRFDINAVIQSGSVYNTDFFNRCVEDYSATGIQFTGYPLKQNSGKMPFSVAIGAGVISADMTTGYPLGGAIMRYFSLSKNIRITPIIGASYVIISKYKSHATYQAFLPISFKFKSGSILFVGPIVMNNGDYNQIGLSLGLAQTWR